MRYSWDDDNNLLCPKCKASMSIKFEFDQEGEEKPHYSLDDEWVCDCGFSLPCRRYSDWFGEDDLHKEVVAYLDHNETQPLNIFYSGFMFVSFTPKKQLFSAMTGMSIVTHFTLLMKNRISNRSSLKCLVTN